MGPNVEYAKCLAREEPGRAARREESWGERSTAANCSAGWGWRSWGQGDRLGGVSGVQQGGGNRNGQKAVTWGYRKQSVVLVRDEMKGQMILFPF